MKNLITLAVTAFILTSCATILNDRTQRINVQTSNNTKTEATIDGRKFSIPGVVELPRQERDAYITTSNKKCTQQTILKSKVDNKFWINVLSGGPFGSSTDYGSEKMWAYDDNFVINCQ